MNPFNAILIIFGIGMAVGVAVAAGLLIGFKLLPDTVEIPPEKCFCERCQVSIASN